MSAIIGCMLVPLSAMAQPKPLFSDQAPATQAPSAPGIEPEITITPLDPPDFANLDQGRTEVRRGSWGSTPIGRIEQLLAALPAAPSDPTARRLQVELLTMPTPEEPPDERLLAVRLQRLVGLGEIDQARSLVDDQGYLGKSSDTAPAISQLELASGRDAEACDAAANAARQATALDEIGLFCAIRRNDQDAALVMQNAMAETDSLRAQPFGALVAVALGYAAPDTVDWSAEAHPVDLAMARQLQLQIPVDVADAATLPAVARLAGDSTVLPALRASARARMDEARGTFTTVGPEATRLRAIPDAAERARAMVQLWQEIPDAPTRIAYLPQLGPIATTITPRIALSEQAPVLAAILLASGQEGAALLWFQMLEVQAGGDRRQADRVAVLMILAGLIDTSRMPASPNGLFDHADAVWLTSGLAGQGVPLSGPWRTVLRSPPPPAEGAPAAILAQALVDLQSSDPAVFAQGLSGLVAADRAIDARSVARSTVIANLHG